MDKKAFALSLAEQVLEESNALKPAYAINIYKQLFVVVGSREMTSIEERISNTEGFCQFFSNPNSNFDQSMRTNQVSGKLYHSIIKTAEHFAIMFS